MWIDLLQGILEEFTEAQRLRTRSDDRGLRIRTYIGDGTSPIAVGEYRSVSAAARSAGLRPTTLQRRLGRGISVTDALVQPSGSKSVPRRLRAKDGTIYGSVKEAASALGVAPATVRNYIRARLLRELPLLARPPATGLDT